MYRYFYNILIVCVYSLCIEVYRYIFAFTRKKVVSLQYNFNNCYICVIDWGTIKNIITNNDSNAYDILDAMCISIFAFGYYFSISYCLLWLCCLSFIPAIVFRQFGIAYNLNLQFRIRYVFPKLRLVKLSTFFLTAVFFEMFFYKTTDNGKQTTVGEDGTTDFTENWLCFATPRLQVNETTSIAATTHSLVVC